MASPITPRTGGFGAGSSRPLSLTPGARVLNKSPLTDDAIWKGLKDAGLDEESIKKRDKAALVGYIAKLETEIFDLHHNMGLLLLEKKELASKHEQTKASAEAAELARKRDKAAHASALAEAKKREESLKKALGVEKECIASIEKTLHEMRAESAEIKIAAEANLAEARSMTEDAQKKFFDAEAKFHAAEALQAEASRYHCTAERKLQEVEAREDDLNRHISNFKSDCDAKEKEINLERQSLSERRKVLQQEQERLLDAQTLLNQREEHIASKSQELNQLEKELEASKANLVKELRAVNNEKSEVDMKVASLSEREEAVIRREADLDRRQQELLVLQEKIASKESVELQKVVATQEAVLKTRRSEFEAKLEMEKKLVEDEIEAKRRAWEMRELDLSQREELLHEREHDLEVQSRALTDKEKDVAEKMDFLKDKEKSLDAAQKDIELRTSLLQQEKQEINKSRLELQNSLDSLEDRKKQVDYAKERLETMKSETDDLSVLEMKLKEEVDFLRAQKLELMAEEERLEAAKAKFEAEWESIDEKREELRKEAECVAEEREAVFRLLKDERDGLRLEKEAMREQHKRDVELLNHEREEFMNKMLQERSDWISKIEQEHADFLLENQMHKRELETSVEKRREEVESYLKDKEKAFELEKKSELQHIGSLREKAANELEQVALEMKKFETVRGEMNLDRDQRKMEWEVLNKSIEELKGQTQKLERQRELLRAEREQISAQIEHLKKLEDIELSLENVKVAKMQQSSMESSRRKLSAVRYLKQHSIGKDASLVSQQKEDFIDNGDVQKPEFVSSPSSAPLSWIKRYSQLIFKNSPDGPSIKSKEKSLISNPENASFMSTGKLDSSNGCHGEEFQPVESFGRREFIRSSLGEPKVILEVHPEGDLAGRKRRGNHSPLDDYDHLPALNRETKKKRLLEGNEAVFLSDQQANNSGAEKDSVLIVDEIRISEVTCETTDSRNVASHDHLLQNPEAIPDQNIVLEGGTNGRANSGDGGNDVLLLDSEVPEILKEYVVNFEHDAGQNQSQEVASGKGD